MNENLIKFKGKSREIWRKYNENLIKCKGKLTKIWRKYKVSLNFCSIFPPFPYRSFKFFFEINSKVSCNLSKISTEKSEIFLKFQKTFSVTCTNFFQNLCKIIPQFLGKTSINARVFRIFLQLFYCSHFGTLFHWFRKTIFQIFQIFIKFLRNFSTFYCFSKLLSHVLKILHEPLHTFSTAFQKLLRNSSGRIVIFPSIYF